MYSWFFLLFFFLTISSFRAFPHKEDDNQQDEWNDKENKNDERRLYMGTLRLTNVIFRHGNRTPDNATSFPSFPIADQMFFPYKMGELTRAGQRLLFNNGANMRQRYNRFLGPVYFTDLVDSTASSVVRTQMSLQAMHAGLFYTRRWNPVKDFPWQAVPYSIIPLEQDNLISMFKVCLSIFYLTNPPNIDQALIDYIKLHSGWTQVTYLQIFLLADFAKTAEEFGLVLPDWLLSIYPERLMTIALDVWREMNIEKKRIIAGPLLKKITGDLMNKANGSLQPDTRKMYLYAGHDVNVHAILAALDLWQNEQVNYGAQVIIELHEINGVHGVKVFYNNNYAVPKLLVIPGCDSFCPLDRFITLTQAVYNPEPVCE